MSRSDKGFEGQVFEWATDIGDSWLEQYVKDRLRKYVHDPFKTAATAGTVARIAPGPTTAQSLQELAGNSELVDRLARPYKWARGWTTRQNEAIFNHACVWVGACWDHLHELREWRDSEKVVKNRLSSLCELREDLESVARLLGHDSDSELLRRELSRFDAYAAPLIADLCGGVTFASARLARVEDLNPGGWWTMPARAA